MSHTRVIINIEVAIRRDDSRYLMIVRGDDEEHAAGMLAFPGGGLDFDERLDVLETTAIREVLEEVGLHVTNLRYVESHSFTVDDEPVVDVVFLARYAGGESIAWRGRRCGVAHGTRDPGPPERTAMDRRQH